MGSLALGSLALLSKTTIFLCSVNPRAGSVPSTVFLLLRFAFREQEEGTVGRRGAEGVLRCSSKLQPCNWQRETSVTDGADAPQQTCRELRGLRDALWGEACVASSVVAGVMPFFPYPNASPCSLFSKNNHA